MYKKGADNRVAGALSRRPHSTDQLLAVSTCAPSWTTDIIQGYSRDLQAQELLSKLTLAPNAVPHYSLHNGVIRYKNRLWLGANKELQ